MDREDQCSDWDRMHGQYLFWIFSIIPNPLAIDSSLFLSFFNPVYLYEFIRQFLHLILHSEAEFVVLSFKER